MLLHGQPQTHATWHRVAPALAARHSVICPDLQPDLGPTGLAQALLELASALGHEQFSLVGQDVGGLIAARMALVAPSRVKRLALLECVPPPEHGGRRDLAFELSTYESCWFGQLHPKREARALTVPAEWHASDHSGVFAPQAVADYTAHRLWTDASGGALSFAPLRDAGDTQQVMCPVLMLWGRQGRNGGWYDPSSLWQPFCARPVQALELNGGTFLAEEASTETASALADFLKAD
ncbi:alpha/beta fold hydrolase [Ameyamaea chiangmaiensis]|uniref:Alpha/beta fold hydrolase n=1 Tax=Ameyamaea chiangmaiensis TaxID=442969 RepID=A0A850P7T4_9PROT|nr:alpha/beta fold hydrolase [Ameyamaea chiangmaiensis]MBS4073756.1 alpha/beta fold hydrolase [Ameyamaea chiangmaiensis]NVN39978.1 alpha/beta fold hydrolase [Ameyamaea chiangmaiensis]